MPRETLTKLYVHAVWSTWDRLPLINAANQEMIYRLILAKCLELGAHPVALGGIEDHIHLLVRFPATLAVAKLVGEVKGVSSHAVNHDFPETLFRWQGAYGAFTVRESDIPVVQHYIQTQAEHHHTLADCTEWNDDAGSDAHQGR